MRLRAITRLLGTALSIVVLAGAVACASDRSPVEPSLPLQQGRGVSVANGLVVSAADPSSGHQGDIQLDVHIFGSGFDSTAKALWKRDGAADSKVVTRGTRFVSSTEIVATIDIASDATLDLYDIAVSITGGGKKGVGLESVIIDAFAVEPGIEFLIPTS